MSHINPAGQTPYARTMNANGKQHTMIKLTVTPGNKDLDDKFKLDYLNRTFNKRTSGGKLRNMKTTHLDTITSRLIGKDGKPVSATKVRLNLN